MGDQRQIETSLDAGVQHWNKALAHLQPLLSTTLTWDNSVLASRQGQGGSSPLASVNNAGGNIGNIAELQRSSMTGMSQSSVSGPGFVTPEASAIVVGGVSVPAGFNIGEVSSAKPYSIGGVSGPD